MMIADDVEPADVPHDLQDAAETIVEAADASGVEYSDVGETVDRDEWTQLIEEGFLEADDFEAEGASAPGDVHVPKHIREWKRERDARISASEPTEPQQVAHNEGAVEAIETELRKLVTDEQRVLSRAGINIDTRQAVRRIAGDYTVVDVHERFERVRLPDRNVGVALDMSASMDGCARAAKAATGAFADALQRLDDSVTIVGYGGFDIDLVTASNESFRWPHLDATHPGGGTPTGRAMEELRDLLQYAPESERAILVVTDGMAGDPERVTKAVAELEADGWPVMGIGIGSVSEEDLFETFGERYRVSSLGTLAEDLFELYCNEVVEAGGIGR